MAKAAALALSCWVIFGPATAIAQTRRFEDRWFSESSPWNTPIAAGTATVPYSKEAIAAYIRTGKPINMNTDVWTVSVVRGDAATDPVDDLLFGQYVFRRVPMPAALFRAVAYTRGRGDTDSAICMYDDSRRAFFTFWSSNINPATGRFTMKTGALFPIDGVGWWDNRGGPWAGRASGASYCGGLIRASELARGRIDHALAVGWPMELIRLRALPQSVVFPATTTDGKGNDPSIAIPMGTRIQLDPALTDADLRAYGLNDVDLVLARALQTYGGYITDSSRVFAFGLESGQGGGRKTYGVSHSWTPEMIKHFRMITPPPYIRPDDRVSVGEPLRR